MYEIELFIIKPGVTSSLQKIIESKLKKAGFIFVIKKKVLFSYKDMKKFYYKTDLVLKQIGQSVIDLDKERNININKIYKTTEPYHWEIQ